ncbi:hypothetical protein H1R20_g8288, partial [Candolleomyces eurysporus]
MAKRNIPLPPFLTGVPVPNYDQARSPWAAIEPGSEIGSFKLADKDVNLFKLWGLVFAHGGGQALNNNNGWSQILNHFDLPEEFPSVQLNGSTSVSTMLSQYYMVILLPFEESYKKNLQENQRKANLANRQGGMMQNPPMGGAQGQAMQQQGMANNPMAMQRIGANPMNPSLGPPNMSQPANGLGRFPQQPQRSQSGVMTPGADSLLPVGNIQDEVLDSDIQGIKRKLDANDLDNKRARPRTDGQDGAALSLGILEKTASEPTVPQLNAVRPRQQPSRRKIEYVPLAREVETYGGRDLKQIENEYLAAAHRRTMRELDEWGPIDVEHLTLSIRSRLSTELSYALTTFTLLSTMKGPTAGSGFPIYQCADLFDEVLDLVEDLAFDGADPSFEETDSTENLGTFTNRQLMNAVLEEETHPFAALEHHQGSKDPASGPIQRPANYILAVVNIIRNLSIIHDNMDYLARHDRLMDLLFRLGKVISKNGVPAPASRTLSLSDVILIRKDTLYTLSSLSNFIRLPPTSPIPKSALRTARHAFELFASYLTDPSEAVSPLACAQQAGVPLGPNMRPPGMVELALDIFDKFSQPDQNRQVLSKAIAQPSLWLLFDSLVRRLPVSEADFQVTMREQWLSYVEKIVMAIYSLVFLAPPELKKKMRSDRSLGCKSIMLRLLHRFMVSTPDVRIHYIYSARRVTETLKLLDDALDPFENPADSSSAPALSFGMGFADSNDTGMEKGTGILGGHRDFGWDMLMLKEVHGDDVMFRELESLVRIESQ